MKKGIRKKKTFDVKNSVVVRKSNGIENYLTFNFSFPTLKKQYQLMNIQDKRIHKKFLQKLHFLSSQPMVDIGLLDKNKGIERIDSNGLDIDVLPLSFKRTEEFLNCDDGIWVFRLGPHERVIAKRNNHIMYIVAIDMLLNVYRHGS